MVADAFGVLEDTVGLWRSDFGGGGAAQRRAGSTSDEE
jgi:hypothetical protein